MINPHSKYFRILAITPSTRGVGFAVLEGQETLVDWGVKSVKGNKNDESLAKIDRLIADYQPGVLVLEDYAHKNSRRSARIRALGRRIAVIAANREVSVAQFTNERVKQAFYGDGLGTKHSIAEVLAQRFPEELGFHLPPKRKLWKSEDGRMVIFDAVALVLTLRVYEESQTSTADSGGYQSGPNE